MIRLNRLALAGDRQSLHDIMKFAHIARPIVALKECQRLRSDALYAAPAMLSRLIEERRQDGFDVVWPFAERRDTELVDVQTIIEIEPETSGFDLGRQVFIGGGDHADVYFDAVRIAERVHYMVFQDAEQLGLGREAHLPDFVQEKGSPGGELKLARLGLLGVREGATLIAEEF